MNFQEFVSYASYIGRWKFVAKEDAYKSFDAEFVVDEFIRIDGFLPNRTDFIEFKGTVIIPYNKVGTKYGTYIIPITSHVDFIKVL